MVTDDVFKAARIGTWEIHYPSAKGALSDSFKKMANIDLIFASEEFAFYDFILKCCRKEDAVFLLNYIKHFDNSPLQKDIKFSFWNHLSQKWQWLYIFNLRKDVINDKEYKVSGYVQEVTQRIEDEKRYFDNIDNSQSETPTDNANFISACWTENCRLLGCNPEEQFKLNDMEKILFREILKFCPMCFAIAVDNVIKFTTSFTHTFLGAKKDDNILDFFVEPDEFYVLEKELEDKGILNWKNITLRTSSGQIKEMLANVSISRYQEKRSIVIWLADVTEIRKVERELIIARDAAESSVKAKSEFLANMSHEIRTPMNAIIGMNYLLMKTFLSPKQLDYAKKIEEASNSLLRIINDILDFSKIESGKMVIENIAFSVTDVVDDIITVYKTLADEKKLKFLVNIDTNIPECLLGDPLRLRQIIVNLVSNAVKFTPIGTITVSVELCLCKEEERIAQLLFSISDTGIGMTHEQMYNLFTPFTQADASTTRRYGGTGLGLAICKNLVNMMNGQIWCTSEEDNGSSFYFTATFEVPYFSSECISSTLTTSGNGIKYLPEHIRGAKILLAEDNEINQMLAMELLKMEGFNVDIANNGLEAIEMIHKNLYDLVLMDIQMPEMDGLTATRHIRDEKQYEKLPIIAMTAHALSNDKKLSMQAGMNDHLIKPIEPDVLYEVLIKWLDRHSN